MSRKSGYSGVWIAEEKFSLSDVIDMNKDVLYANVNTAMLLSLKNEAKANEKIRGLSGVY